MSECIRSQLQPCLHPAAARCAPAAEFDVLLHSGAVRLCVVSEFSLLLRVRGGEFRAVWKRGHFLALFRQGEMGRDVGFAPAPSLQPRGGFCPWLNPPLSLSAASAEFPSALSL